MSHNCRVPSHDRACPRATVRIAKCVSNLLQQPLDLTTSPSAGLPVACKLSAKPTRTPANAVRFEFEGGLLGAAQGYLETSSACPSATVRITKRVSMFCSSPWILPLPHPQAYNGNAPLARIWSSPATLPIAMPTCGCRSCCLRAGVLPPIRSNKLTEEEPWRDTTLVTSSFIANHPLRN